MDEPHPAPEFSTELTAAREFARLGGRIAMEHFRNDPKAERKDDGTWVTEADWAVEAQIRLRIARTFPDHNVHGEEEGLTAAGGGPPNEMAPTWVIDPIDGTNNYIAGIPVWATLVGLRVAGRSVVGVAHVPALGETYDAAVGMGARMNDEPIFINGLPELSDATFLYADAAEFSTKGLGDLFEELVGRSFRTRGFGDFWGHLLVARGAAHVMIEPELSLWDFTALEPIVREAGGEITRLDGEACTNGGSCLTTNGRLHDEVLRLMRERAPAWTEP